MSIHNEETKKIRSNDVLFVFFNKKDIKSFNPRYIEMIKRSKKIENVRIVKTIFMVDKLGKEYKIKTSFVDDKDGVLTIKEDRKANCMFLATRCLWLKNNGFPQNTIIDDEFFDLHMKDLPLIKKDTEIKNTVWNIRNLFKTPCTTYSCPDYSVLIVIDDQIAGRINSEIVKDKSDFFDNNNITYDNLNLYIAEVDIRPDFQGLGLCRPMLSYMIKNLKKLGYEMLFINNASSTNKGKPACICYYKAGIENGYKMRYGSKQFKTMNIDECHKTKKMPRDYYYMSEDIYKRGIAKLKKHIFKKTKIIRKSMKAKNNK